MSLRLNQILGGADIRSPIFYDSNDTTYYFDGLASTSLNISGQITTAKTNGTLFSIAGVDTIGYNSTAGRGAYIKGTGSTYVYGSAIFADGANFRQMLYEDTWLNNKYFDSNGIIYSQASMRAPIFYDYNDTAYYCDPASTSRLNILSVGTGAILINGAATATDRNLKVKGASSTNIGIVLYDSSDNFRCQLYGESGSYGFLDGVWAGWDLRKSIGGSLFLNNNNTYYLNPASTTVLNALSVSVNNGLNPAVGTWHTSSEGKARFYFSSNSTTFFRTGANFVFRNDSDIGVVTIDSVGNLRTSTSGDNFASYSLHVGGTGFASADFRSPIFYDSNNTAYYIDAASTSNLNNLTVAGTMTFGTLAYVTESRRSKNSSNVDIETVTGLVSPSGPTFLEIRGFCPPTMFRTTGDRPAPYGIGFGNGAESGGIMPIGAGDNLQEIMLYGSNTGPTTFTFKRQNWESNTYDPSNSNSYSASVFSINTGTGAVTASTDIRSPIYYDSNNTSYYLDPASTSVINAISIAGNSTFSGDSYLTFGPNSTWGSSIRFGGNGYTATGTEMASVVTTDGNLHLDAAKSTNGIYLNWYGGTSGVFFGNGSAGQAAFVSSSGNAVFNGSVTTTYGSFTAPALVMGDAQYGFYVVSGNVYYKSASGGVHYWRNIANSANTMSLDNSGSLNLAADVRAPIFYDSDNTAYYINGASGSKLKYLQIDGDWGSSPFGSGHESFTIRSTYASMCQRQTNGSLGYWLHHVASDAVYYLYGGRGATDGSSWDWSYRAYPNQDGSFVEFRTSARAPIFYDSNNTAYYTDPASTSVLYSIAAGVAGNSSANIPALKVTSSGTATTQAAIAIQQQASEGDTIIFCDFDQYVEWNLIHENANNQLIIHGGTSTSNLGSNTFYSPNGTAKTGYIKHVFDMTDGNAYIGGSVGIGTNGPGQKLDVRGTIISNSDVRAPIFYDSDNTGYYLNPVGNSQLSAVYANNWFRAQGNTGLYFEDKGYGITSAGAASNSYGNASTYGSGLNGWQGWGIGSRHCMMSTGGDNFGIHDNTRSWLYYWDGTYHRFQYGYLESANSVRGPLFYDSDNTSYYCDPASTSILNIVNNRENTPGGSGNTYYWSGSAMSFYWTKIANVSGGNTHAAILITYKTDVNYNPFGLALLSVSAFNSQTFSVKLEKLNGDSMQILVRVDNNNDVWLLTAAEWSSYKTWKVISKLGSPTVYYSSLTEQLTTPANSIEIASGQEVRGTQGAATSATVSTVSNHLFGGLTVRSDVRAPIFYDSNDTAYYLDPASTSNLNKFSAFTMSYNDMNSMHVNSPYVARYNGSALYRNGTMGYGTTDCNVMFSNWGSGFIDSWGSPANAPGSSSHYVGLQGFHYNHQDNSQAYGFQMLCAGESNNRFFWRSAWPTLRTWVEMIHTGNINSQADLRAPIFYDSNNTSYYVDPASTSNLLGLTVANTITGSISGNAGSVTNGVYTNTGNTFTNINVFNSPNNTTIGGLSGNYGLTVYQATAGTDAYMTFHVGGDFAAYFGMGGAENDLVYGGWSVGNFRYRILHSSNAPYAWNMNQYVRTTDNVTFGTVTATLSGNASTATNLSTTRSNWSTNGTIAAVVGQLCWKNYGNGHTIIDASNSTSPAGGAIGNTNPDVAWTGTYPTLMGWNGTNTYGVRVDSTRYSDQVSYAPNRTDSTTYPVLWGAGSSYTLAYSCASVYIQSSTGTIYANGFYDAGNTAYYVDPASTSNLVGLTVANVITGNISGNAGTVTNGVYLSGAQTIGGVKTFSDPPVALNIAKAWVHFNGTSSVGVNCTVNASYNISSVAHNATGDYTVNFTNSFTDTNYVVAGTITYDYTLASSLYNGVLSVPRQSGAQSTGSCRIAAEYLHGANLYDAIAVRAVFFR